MQLGSIPDAMATASAEIDSYIARAQKVLYGDSLKHIEASKFSLDPAADNFRFDKNGHVTGWFDPLVPKKD